MLAIGSGKSGRERRRKGSGLVDRIETQSGPLLVITCHKRSYIIISPINGLILITYKW